MNNKKQKQMGFLRINSLHVALLAVLGAMIVVIITANITNSSNTKRGASETEGITSEAVLQLTDANFQQTIKKGVTLVDFWAVWCGPCRMQAPIINEVAEEMGTKVKVGKLDVDKNQSTSMQYGIRNIPTMLIFKDGKVVQSMVGLKSKEQIIDALNMYLTK